MQHKTSRVSKCSTIITKIAATQRVAIAQLILANVVACLSLGTVNDKLNVTYVRGSLLNFLETAPPSFSTSRQKCSLSCCR
ncbi:hypothetical protein D918_08251 [Trichuris suis]|nr:hypothetical protein D918_08251 [Trichuris suis]